MNEQVKKLISTHWLGEVGSCDICGKELTITFIDGATRMGPWAKMCGSCYDKYGVGLGLGKGQAYDVKTKEKIGG